MDPLAPLPIIEAFGSPGVGKSYTVANLMKVIEPTGMKVQREPYSLAGSARFHRALRKGMLLVLQTPGLVRYAMAIATLLRQNAWISRAEMFRAVFNWLVVISALRYLRHAPGPVLFGQGVFQAIWSLAFRARADDSFPLSAWIDLTLTMLPNRDLSVLLVNADAATVALRLETRTNGQSLLGRGREAGAMARAQRATDDLAQRIKELAAKGKVRLVEFDNEANGFQEEAMRKLATELGLTSLHMSRDPG